MTTPVTPVEPRTAAGRALVKRMRDADAPSDFFKEVVAIESEAAMNGYNLHIEQLGPPDRAAFMEGYNEAKEQAAEAAGVPLLRSALERIATRMDEWKAAVTEAVGWRESDADSRMCVWVRDEARAALAAAAPTVEPQLVQPNVDRGPILSYAEWQRRQAEPQRTEGGVAAGLDRDRMIKASDRTAVEFVYVGPGDLLDNPLAVLAAEYDRLAAAGTEEER